MQTYAKNLIPAVGSLASASALAPSQAAGRVETPRSHYDSGGFLLPKCRGVNLFVPAARQGSIKDKGKIQDGVQVLFHRV